MQPELKVPRRTWILMSAFHNSFLRECWLPNALHHAAFNSHTQPRSISISHVRLVGLGLDAERDVLPNTKNPGQRRKGPEMQTESWVGTVNDFSRRNPPLQGKQWEVRVLNIKFVRKICTLNWKTQRLSSFWRIWHDPHFQ